MEPQPLVSIVLSFRNEEQVIPELIARLRAALVLLPIDFELIFVNDDSTDRSLTLLTEHAREDPRVKIVNMSRRFGVSECVLAGMQYARGDAIIYMDTDLQDPPELLPEMIDKWRQGADVVYTVRASRQGESVFKLWLTRRAYHFINAASDIDLPVEAGDFKLLSRRVVDELLKLKEKNPYLRGLVRWVGFKQVPVYYTRQPRAAGVTHFPIFGSKGPIMTFVSGFTSFSTQPLTAFLWLGLLVCLVALVFLVIILARALTGTPLSDWAGLAAILLLVSGVQLIGIGTLGLYLGRVYNDVRDRPHYIVESTVGFDKDT
jgi:dolichol-phosphate mannosyltransferase